MKRRIYEPKEKLIKGFTSKCKVTKFVFYEIYDDIISAIEREKQIKAGDIIVILHKQKSFSENKVE